VQELEKIDIIRERLGVSYQAAKEALDKANGDVVQALISLDQKNTSWDERIQSGKSKMAAQVKGILHHGNATRIHIKKDGETVFELPATVGALGLLGMMASSHLAILAGLGGVAGMLNQYSLKVEKEGVEQKEQQEKTVQTS
jgi:NACalpha-BTF3-like transcription factor